MESTSAFPTRSVERPADGARQPPATALATEMARAFAVALAGTEYTAFVVVLSPPAVADTESVAVVHHSPDFASVNWGGTVYTFTRIQRKVVAELWRAREAGYHFVSQSRLLAHVESDCKRVRDLFRRHPAFGVLIVPGEQHGGRAGTYRLAPEPAHG